jgi:hypothetical protein
VWRWRNPFWNPLCKNHTHTHTHIHTYVCTYINTYTYTYVSSRSKNREANHTQALVTWPLTLIKCTHKFLHCTVNRAIKRSDLCGIVLPNHWFRTASHYVNATIWKGIVRFTPSSGNGRQPTAPDRSRSRPHTWHVVHIRLCLLRISNVFNKNICRYLRYEFLTYSCHQAW